MDPTPDLLIPVRNKDQAVGPAGNLLKGIIDTVGVEYSVAFGEKKTLPQRSQVIENAPKASLEQQQLDYALDAGTLPKTITVRNEDSFPCHTQHLFHDGCGLRDVMEDCELANHVEACV